VDPGKSGPQLEPFAGTFMLFLLGTLALIPLFFWNVKRYQHSYYTFSSERTQFVAGPWAFYKLFFQIGLVWLVVCLVLSLLFVIGAAVAIGVLRNVAEQSLFISALVWLGLMAPAAAVFAFGVAVSQSMMQNLVWIRTREQPPQVPQRLGCIRVGRIDGKEPCAPRALGGLVLAFRRGGQSAHAVAGGGSHLPGDARRLHFKAAGQTPATPQATPRATCWALISESEAMNAVPTTALTVTYLDGHSARPHVVQMHRGPDRLYLVGEGVEAHIPLDQVDWPERTRHGVRIAHFRQGGEVQCSDLAAWDRWVAVYGPRESAVVRMQRSWRSVLVSAVVLLGLLFAAYGWGLPVLGHVLVAATPVSVDQTLGESSLEALDDSLMRPTKLSSAQQLRVLQGWQQVVAALPADQAPPWRLVFRDSRIGPNAFALPGDTMVMTDQLVELVDGDLAVLSAVLAHELGHLKHRHGMQMLVKAGLLGAVTSVVFGDFSGLLSAVPLLLGHAHYSRDAERQADAFPCRSCKPQACHRWRCLPCLKSLTNTEQPAATVQIPTHCSASRSLRTPATPSASRSSKKLPPRGRVLPATHRTEAKRFFEQHRSKNFY